MIYLTLVSVLADQPPPPLQFRRYLLRKYRALRFRKSAQRLERSGAYLHRRPLRVPVSPFRSVFHRYRQDTRYAAHVPQCRRLTHTVLLPYLPRRHFFSRFQRLCDMSAPFVRFHPQIIRVHTAFLSVYSDYYTPLSVPFPAPFPFFFTFFVKS